MSQIDPRHTKLERDIQPMPDDIRQQLEHENVLDDYYARPDYQQNDYLAWITAAKQPETRQKRLQIMIAELRQGGIYMNMEHVASRK